MNDRAPRVWHIEERFDRFYVDNQYGGFARWHTDRAAAVAQGLAYVTDDGDTFLDDGNLTVRAMHGKVFNVRYEVRKGLSGRPIGEEKTLAFYDADYLEKFPPYGQFVSDYLPRSLDGCTTGLNLHGGVPNWWVDAHTMSTVLAWLHEQQEKENV